MTAPLSAEQLAGIQWRHERIDERYPPRDPDARDAHEDRGLLLAELALVRAERLTLARYVAYEADPTGETLPDLTYGEARDAIDIAAKLVKCADETDHMVDVRAMNEADAQREEERRQSDEAPWLDAEESDQ